MVQKLSIEADDGERLDVHVHGAGAPLLLLHGWGASHAAWSPLVDALAQRHRVIRPDARGHGAHRVRPGTRPDLARLARDVLNILDALQLERASVAGHSMGALTLWRYIGDHGTERLDRLCCIDQSPRLLTDAHWRHGIYGDFDAARSQHFVAALQAEPVESVLRLVAHGLNDPARASYARNGSGWRTLRQELAKLDPTPLVAIWQSLVAADLRKVLPRIDRPTLLVHGSASNFYTEATARWVASQIPGATLRVYEGADHCPHLLQPARFLDDLAGLLASAHRDPVVPAGLTA